jgi:hypothetical protein
MAKRTAKRHQAIPRASMSYVRPYLYPKQVAAIFVAIRLAIIEATPKSGKTVGCLVWLFEQALKGRPGDNFWWIAPVFSQADIAFRRMKQFLPTLVFTANEARKTITLANRTTIWFKSADSPDALFGEDVRAAVIDEAPRCKEETWHAVRTTLTATKGPIRIIGNVKGRRNWAYHLARQAEAGEPGMHYAKITALDAIEAGIFDVAELAAAERDLPAAVFRELYYAEPSDDQGNPFGLDAIRACLAPLSTKVPVAWGWDLAKSVDWTVGIALDEDGAVCRFERRQGSWEQIFDTIIRMTGETPALVDSTGVGDPIVERLQRVGGGVFKGFHFSAPAKQQLMEGLVVAIQQRRVYFPEGPITSELETFEYEYTRTGVRYRAPEGLHDDCVCALGLAVRHRTTHFDAEPLLLLGGSGDEPDTGESFVKRAIARHGAFFPVDWR